MTDHYLPKINRFFLVFCLAILITACNFPSNTAAGRGGVLGTSTTLQDTYPVDALFRDFYDYLGGQEVLGPAISPLQEAGSRKQQYVQNGLMVFDPQATRSDRFRLAPLGKNFEVEEPPVPDPEEAELRYINGHIIHPDFLPLYEELGGARFVGLPLTEARHNPAKKRIEQYFENLGIYQVLDGAPGLPRLMAYGAFACDLTCRYVAPDNSIPEAGAPLPEPFASRVSMLGLHFTGKTLSEPYRAPDGKVEMIFENLVLAADFEGAEQAFARPIPQLLGIQAQSVGACQDNGLADCFPGVGGQDYQVPSYFQDYIRQHGGWDIAGMPMTNVFVIEKGVFRQCFTNLCLEFNLNVAPESRLGPVPLGKMYKDQYYELFSEDEFEEDFAGMLIQVWEAHPLVASGEAQEIHVTLSENGSPLTNREPVLFVTMPDDSRQTYTFPPTGQDGKTSLRVPPIDTPNGTLIPYEVCLVGLRGKTFCVGDNYLIWNFP
jgi:hypothetical protein